MILHTHTPAPLSPHFAEAHQYCCYCLPHPPRPSATTVCVNAHEPNFVSDTGQRNPSMSAVYAYPSQAWPATATRRAEGELTSAEHRKWLSCCDLQCPPRCCSQTVPLALASCWHHFQSCAWQKYAIRINHVITPQAEQCQCHIHMDTGLLPDFKS